MKTKHCGGVRTLQDIKNRCYINDETDCWEWSGSVVRKGNSGRPSVHIAKGIFTDLPHGGVMSAHRVAWRLSGRKLQKGHLVWRHLCDADKCVNPEHCKSGTRQEMHTDISESGRNRGSVERHLIILKSSRNQLLPVEKVRAAESMFDEGATQKEVMAALRISNTVCYRIKTGTHQNSRAAVSKVMLRGASIFTMGI